MRSFNIRMLRALTTQVGTSLTHTFIKAIQQQELLTSKNLSYKPS